MFNNFGRNKFCKEPLNTEVGYDSGLGVCFVWRRLRWELLSPLPGPWVDGGSLGSHSLALGLWQELSLGGLSGKKRC